MININTYCSHAFTSYDHRMKSICCRAHNHDPVTSYAHTFDHPAIQQLRQDLVNGIRNPICEVCWKDEDVGMVSTRQDSIANKTPQEMQSEVDQPRLKWLWIDPGNYCNLACRTCFPTFSVPIGIEWSDRWENSKMLTVRKPDLSLIAQQDFSAIETVMILGGEPFLNMEHLQIIDRVIEQKTTKDLRIIYVTNNSKRMPDRIVDYLKSFAWIKIIVLLSVDAVGREFDYIRTKGKWQDFVTNLQYLQFLQRNHPNLSINANLTIGLLNCLYLDDLYTWLQSNGISGGSITSAFVEGADYYSFRTLDISKKGRVIDQLRKSVHDFGFVIQAIKESDFDPELVDLFWKETEWTKQYHGLDIRQYLPKLVSLLED